MTLADVAQAWAEGRKAKATNMRTDGRKVWSFGLVIGHTVGGQKVAVDYRGMESGSTSRHCGLVIAHADLTREPS